MLPWYFNPILAQIGPLTLRWYGFMYSIGFFLAYLWFYYSKLGKNLGLKNEQKDTLLLVVIFGVLLGGRVGYILFYNLPYYLQNPLEVFEVWKGGMSFHGGLLGVFLALLWATRKYAHLLYKKAGNTLEYKMPFLKLADLVTGIAPLGLFFGRIGNFINGELYGRVATSFCLHFPTDPTNCRYPSQLLQSLLEGLTLFLILLIVSKYSKKTGMITSFFLFFYGIFRISAEFFREPDAQIGYLWGGITEGQLLSAAMVVAGVILFFVVRRFNFTNPDRTN